MKNFSPQLQEKIAKYLTLAPVTQMGKVTFSSPLILAPMAGITDTPFRLLMQELGAGCTISELIAATGLHYKSEKTDKMLTVSPLEKCVGLQLFGDNPDHMAEAAKIAEERGARFIDINMGCPVNKVVKRGAGSALLIAPQELYSYLAPIKKVLNVPLTIKIRTGWNKKNLTAPEILKVAKDLDIHWVSVHGRTREEHYSGNADWDYLEKLAEVAKSLNLPLIGNGDLHHTEVVHQKLKTSRVNALMLGRGPLRNPFLFLEGLDTEGKFRDLSFTANDYLEVIEKLYDHQSHFYNNEHIFKVNFRKLVVWMASGLPNATHFRGKIFSLDTVEQSLDLSRDYFQSAEVQGHKKEIDYNSPFMNGGHG